MDAKLQRRVQRYGWDLASGDYDPLWQRQLESVQSELLQWADVAPGEHVIDVACGSGLVTLRAAQAAGPSGRVVGVDISEQMLQVAARRTQARDMSNVAFARMDAEALQFDAGSFNVALCSLGLMYLPEPEQAMREMLRVLRPGGRLALCVWGERDRCGWSALFGIVQDEVDSQVCPLFFRLGQRGALERACRDAGFEATAQRVVTTTLLYANADEACRAAFVGGPVALAWSRFDDETRARVVARYTDSIARWQVGEAYAVPAEFVLVAARAPTRHDG